MAYPQLTDKPGALETAAAIRSGEMSVAEAVDAAITRIEKLDADIDALAVPDFERAAQTAKAMDRDGPDGDQPFFGVPMTVKESFDVAGLQSCWGHERLTDYIAPSDSDLVRRMKAPIFVTRSSSRPVERSPFASFLSTAIERDLSAEFNERKRSMPHWHPCCQIMFFCGGSL